MAQLYLALSAFWAVLTKKPAVYTSHTGTYIVGNQDDIKAFLVTIADEIEDATEQAHALNQAKKIIQN